MQAGYSWVGLGWVGLEGLLGWVWVGCAPENFGLGWVGQTDPMQDLARNRLTIHTALSP